MYATRLPARLPVSKQTAAHLSSALASLTHSYSTAATHGLRLSCIVAQQQQPRRQFSSTSRTRLREYFPPPSDAPSIRQTDPAWPHPGYTEGQMQANITYEHRRPKEWSDRIALGMMRMLRWGTDLATGYYHDVEEPKRASDKDALTTTKPYKMNERKWLIRFIFLESVAGVPGMVGGALRHLHSIRRMKRDNGWIETLLEEAYNERMHLLTFLQLAEPGWFMRFMCLGAQGVFFNSMFLAYLISPRTCHRFVGYLEEEAVLTYGLAIADIEAGKLPKWEKLPIPEIAVNYWKIPEGMRSMRHLLMYIRADEAKHREVNHTLGNLHQKEDPNPFVSTYKDPSKAHPSKGIEHTKGTGWEREEVI